MRATGVAGAQDEVLGRSGFRYCSPNVLSAPVWNVVPITLWRRLDHAGDSGPHSRLRYR
jgi:hypothetical protein